MIAVGVQEAAGRFPQLLALAAGRPDARKLVEEMLAARDQAGPTLGPGLTVRELIEDGRP